MFKYEKKEVEWKQGWVEANWNIAKCMLIGSLPKQQKNVYDRRYREDINGWGACILKNEREHDRIER